MQERCGWATGLYNQEKINKKLLRTPPTCSTSNRSCIPPARHLQGSKGLQRQRCFTHVFFYAGQSTSQQSPICFRTHNNKKRKEKKTWKGFCQNFILHILPLEAFSHTVGLFWVKNGLTGHRTNGYRSFKAHVCLHEAFLEISYINRQIKELKFGGMRWIKKQIINLSQLQYWKNWIN